MAHEALYRKARPRTFGEVIGQEVVVGEITRAIVDGRLSQSILLSGHYGCGKTSIARLIAASVNCEFRADGSADPCGGSNPACTTCAGVIEGDENMGGVREMDAASSRSIDSIRAMIDTMSMAINARHRVYIIDEAHKLSKDAMTALLKTLEEPPPGVVIIMATTDPQSIDKIVRSRLTQYTLSGLDRDSLGRMVRRAADNSGIEVADSDVNAILARANMSGRDALNYLERWSQGDRQVDSSPLNFLNGITDALVDSDEAAILLLINERVVTHNEDPAAVLVYLTEHFREALIAAKAPSMTSATGDWKDAAEYAASKFNTSTILAVSSALLAAHRPGLPNARLALEQTLLDFVQRRKRSGQGGGGSRLSESEIDAITDALTGRLGEMLDERLGGLSLTPLGAAPAGTLDTSRQDTVDTSLSETAAAVSKPLPGVGETRKDGETRALFDPRAFAESIKRAGLSRRGGIVLDRHFALELSDKTDNLVRLVCGSGKSFDDSDWAVAESVVKGFGYDLEEVLSD